MARKYPPKKRPCSVYVLKVTLEGSKPKIWRRLHVLSNMLLGDLHYALQITMGWTNSHLHDFLIEDKRYTSIVEEFELDFELDSADEDCVTVGEVITGAGQTFQYIYDFGDGWEHIIEVEKVLAPDHQLRYPMCVGGKMACPPDDCGGIGGYYNMLRILKKPGHRDYDMLFKWIGGEFDPAEFDLASVNAELNYIPQWRKWAEGEN